MDVNGEDGPPPFADDLSRRRLIDAVVDAAVRPRSGARAGRWLGLSAAAAAAAAIAVLALRGEPGEAPPLSAGTAETTAAEPAALRGRVLLVSGDSDAEEAILDHGFQTGDRLPSASGMTVVALGPGIRVALRPGAEARAARLDGEAAVIDVRAGALLAWVDPDRGRPRLTVETPAGAIAVEGTVFRLEVAGERAEVEVLRGRITLLEPDREPRRIGIGEAAVLGPADGEPPGRSAEEEVRGVIGLLELLAAEHDARIEIRSLPAGAVVSLDGVALGATPLRAAIRPGHRDIALDLPGHAPVREILEVARGDLVSRVFDLAPAARAETAAIAAPRSALGPTAAELLAEAQALRAARDWQGAAAAYGAIVDSHGGSTEARSAAISAATIRLDHLGDPRGALRMFDGYLARHGAGALAQEAAWGRCRALRALGREAEELRALEAFVAAYPGALEADRARSRLLEIGK